MYGVSGENVWKRIVGGVVAFLIATNTLSMELPNTQSPGGAEAPRAEERHPANERPGGAGWDEVNNVPKSTHTRIAEGCSYKAEMVFYITDEKKYNGGDVNKMQKFMLDNMSQAEYRIKIKLFTYLHAWIDRYAEANEEWSLQEMPVHEVTWAFFNECMSNSYNAMSLKPTDLTKYYMEGFGTILGEALEGAVPIDT